MMIRSLNTTPARTNATRQTRRPLGPPNEDGFTLLLAMVMILVLTVFGVFALNSSILQNRMSANYRDDKVSFEGAELTLRWGESFLQSRTPVQRPFPCQRLDANDPNSNCNAPGTVIAAGYLVKSAPDIPDVEERDPWTDTDYWQIARFYGEDPSIACGSPPCLINTNTQYDLTNANRNERALSEQPRYILEEVFVDRDDLAGNPQQGRVFYRIYAGSTGERRNTISILQSSVAKRFQ
jgi:type IV pilus assembly protein PilX